MHIGRAPAATWPVVAAHAAEGIHVHRLHAHGRGALDVVETAVADVQDPIGGRPSPSIVAWKTRASGLPTPTSPESVTTSTGTPAPPRPGPTRGGARWSATVPSLFDVTARRTPASARRAAREPGTGWHHTGVRSTSTAASWAARLVRLGHADGGEEARQVVGEVLGVGGGPVHRRHGLVVAHAEAVRSWATPAAVEGAGERPVVGDHQHTPHVEADRVEPPRHRGAEDMDSRLYFRQLLAGRDFARRSDRPPDGELRLPGRRSRDRRGRRDRPGLRHPGPARRPGRRRHAAHRRPRHPLPPRPHRRLDGGLRHRRHRGAARRSRRCRSTCRPTRSRGSRASPRSPTPTSSPTPAATPSWSARSPSS